MNKTPILDLFVNEKKIDQTIQSLEEKKANLDQIVNEVIITVLKKKFPDRDYNDIVSKNDNVIKLIKESLHEEYSNEISLRINHLYLLKTEISK